MNDDTKPIPVMTSDLKMLGYLDQREALSRKPPRESAFQKAVIRPVRLQDYQAPVVVACACFVTFIWRNAYSARDEDRGDLYLERGCHAANILEVSAEDVKLLGAVRGFTWLAEHHGERLLQPWEKRP